MKKNKISVFEARQLSKRYMVAWAKAQKRLANWVPAMDGIQPKYPYMRQVRGVPWTMEEYRKRHGLK